MQNGFFYDFSNYGVYERLGDDGITTWHPAFLALGEDIEECSRKYKKFCHQYKSQEKKGKKFYWGDKLIKKRKIRKIRKIRKKVNNSKQMKMLRDYMKFGEKIILK
jgi:putative transposase